VAVAGAPALADDTWIEVTGHLSATATGPTAATEAGSVRQIGRPANPYE
jgi:uncharacterized membrane protein YcgQ (UPF0703/DUF1980 family)